jgi:hypothetical protein
MAGSGGVAFPNPTLARMIEVPQGEGRAAMEVIGMAAGVLLLIGFFRGYGVRALISRWRHAKATRRRFERTAEEDPDEEA